MSVGIKPGTNDNKENTSIYFIISETKTVGIGFLFLWQYQIHPITKEWKPFMV